MFVVGCPRSGTTLLQRMLDNHPDLTVANDTHFIPRALPGERAPTDPPLTTELLERVLAYKRFGRLGVEVVAARRLAEGALTYAELVSRLYDEVARRDGKRWAGEKTPDYGRHLALLHALFPWAPVLHIVRDGRDVALSTLEWATPEKGPGRFALWASEPVAVCALWWRWQISTAHRDGQAMGSASYREVRYEDLLADPAVVMGELLTFVGLAPTDLVLRYHEGRVDDRPGLSAKRAWLPPTKGLRDWSTSMAPADVELFEALAGDVLDRFGYRRASGPPSAGIARRADACRRWWDTELARREEKRASGRGR